MPRISDLWRANARKVLRSRGNPQPTKYEVAKLAHQLYMAEHGTAYKSRDLSQTKKYIFGMWDSSPQGAKNLRFKSIEMDAPDKPGPYLDNKTVRECLTNFAPMYDAKLACPVRWLGGRFQRWNGHSFV
jgi:hypothetical protein